MANPRITIETYLEKIKQGDIKAIGQQLKQMSGQVEKLTSGVAVRNKLVGESVKVIKESSATLGRGMTQSALRTKIATQQLNSFKEAALAGKLVLQDMVSVTGFANAALNIMISRFGTMIIIFGLVRAWGRWNQAMKDANLELDTARRKVESLIIPTTNMETAMDSLFKKMVTFGITVGGTFEQLADTQFLLASSGLKSAKVYALFNATQKLVLATSKDLNATQGENKQIVEAFAGIYKNFGETLKGFNSEQEKATYIADLIFYAFKRNQILLPELASGFTYAAAQAKIMRIPLAELILVLAKANSVMIKSSKAGTSLANALSDIIKRAPVLAKKFDIKLDLDKEEGFSFIKEVLIPLNKKLEESSNRLEFLTDLMAVWNKRGVRIVSALLPVVKELSEEYDNAAIAIGGVDKAMEVIIESTKNQEQIQKNLFTVINYVMEAAVHGGLKRNQVLLITNKLLRDNLNSIIAMAHGIAIMTAGLYTVLGAIAQMAISFKNLVDVIIHVGRLGQDMFNVHAWEEAGENIQREIDDWDKGLMDVAMTMTDMWDGVAELGKLAATGFESVGEAIDAILTKEEKLLLAVEDSLKVERLRAKVRESVIKTLGREKTYYDKFGQALDATAYRISNVSKEFEYIQKAAREASSSFEDFVIPYIQLDPEAQMREFLFVKLAEDSRASMEQIFAKADAGEYFQEFSLQFKGMAKSLPEHMEEANRKVNYEIANLVHEWRDARRKVSDINKTSVGQLLAIDNKFWADIIALQLDGEEAKEKIRERFHRKELSDFRYQSSQIIQSLKNRYAVYAQLASGVTLKELDFSEFEGLKLSDIMFDPDEFASIRNELQAEMEAVLSLVDRAIHVKAEVLIDKRGVAYAKIGPEFKQSIYKLYDEGFKVITTTIKKQADALEEEAFQEFIKRMVELGELKETFATKYADLIAKSIKRPDDLTASERKRLDEYFKSIDEPKQKLIDALTNRIKGIGKAYTEVVREINSAGEIRIADKLDIEGEVLAEGREALKKYTLEITTQLGILSDSFANVGDIFVDITNIIVAENNRAARSFAETVQQMLRMTSQLISMYLTYRRTVSSLEAAQLGGLAGLNQIGFVLAAVSVVASAISAIRDIGKREEIERQQLKQEFLPQDAAARVSSDYGQARVINQRITLTPVFQLLDPSQLTEAVQRNLAVAIYDNLLELEKESG